MSSSENLVTTYLDWLKQNITVREVDGWTQISAPFLDRHNDFMQIYVRAEGETLRLTDDGYVLSDLHASGVDLTTPRRRELLEQIIRGFGIQLDQDELTATATKSTFAQRKHALLQAMMSVNDLFLTSRGTIKGLFLEDVERFLQEQQIRFVPSVQVSGKSGLSHTFDYVIPAWNRVPERILKAMNTPTKDKIQSMLYAWDDIREIRKGSHFYAMFNDTERALSSGLMAACEDKGVNVVPWSRRAEYVAVLSA